MTQDIRKYLGKEYLFYDGGTGTYLQAHGLQPGELPEGWNLTHPEMLISMHRSFLEAGSNILLTNTFGANAGKLADTDWNLESLVKAGVANAREAVKRHQEAYPEDNRPLFVSLDIGPSGHLMKPYGDLSFEEAYNWFAQVACYGQEAGADLITIETMSDSYEVKAALLAVKENTSLPVFVTMVFDQSGRLLTGGEIPGTAALLEGLGADAIGLNCGLGPYQMEGLVDILAASTSLPIIVNPNAGLPRTEEGKTVYDIEPEEFGSVMECIAAKGAWVLGGCCGTTDAYIRATVEHMQEKKPVERQLVNKTIVTSYSQAVEIGVDPVIIGERLNPTGKKWLKTALAEGDTDRILKEALQQQDDGAHILDVNVGLPGLDEAAKFEELIPAIQAVTDLPLQIDTSSPEAMERAVRLYNGKPMLNSVNGKKESMEAVFHIVKKYGGVVVGLCLDEEGIPADAEGRIRIARKIIDTAASYGIAKKDIVIDALALTVSADAGSARVTLETLRRL
ncbi:MAG: homocysteine S-methyltransferase family protein, partial [Lachnospiraceae bacterium]|nr:homocysteine S-methyltransferase family protein [Lachnospiraceae bacterium]